MRTTSSGKLVDGWQWRIVDDDGKPVKDGELGLLEAKGAATPGCLDNEPANLEAFAKLRSTPCLATGPAPASLSCLTAWRAPFFKRPVESVHERTLVIKIYDIA